MVTQRLIADGNVRAAGGGATRARALRDVYGGLTLAGRGADERAEAWTSGTRPGQGSGALHGGRDGLAPPGGLLRGTAPPEHAIGQ